MNISSPYLPPVKTSRLDQSANVQIHHNSIDLGELDEPVPQSPAISPGQNRNKSTVVSPRPASPGQAVFAVPAPPPPLVNRSPIIPPQAPVRAQPSPVQSRQYIQQRPASVEQSPLQIISPKQSMPNQAARSLQPRNNSRKLF
jgi:hypothetical protein